MGQRVNKIVNTIQDINMQNRLGKTDKQSQKVDHCNIAENTENQFEQIILFAPWKYPTPLQWQVTVCY